MASTSSSSSHRGTGISECTKVSRLYLSYPNCLEIFFFDVLESHIDRSIVVNVLCERALPQNAKVSCDDKMT